jgi:hypothetical protein
MTTNRQRARWAKHCADRYASLTCADDASDAIVDLIASLGHHAQAQGFDYLDLVATAVAHWHVEQADPESIDPLPPVTITIHESSIQ